MTDSRTPNGATVLCETLSALGVTTLFGVPGDTGVGWYDALFHHPGLEHVLVNDERGAVFAADAYARRSGRLGVAEVSSGGGATFCIGGVGEAYAASVPLLILSSDIHRQSRGTGALTETDQVAMFSAVTKWTVLVEDADSLSGVLVEAARRACSGRPGPVAVIVPEDLYEEECRPTGSVEPAFVPAERTSLDPGLVDSVSQMWARSAKPAILAGGGVHFSDAYAALVRLAELTDTPVATTIHGKGAIAETHPLAIGVVGGNGGREYATDYVAGADFVLLLGTRANATDTDGFRAPPRDAIVVTLDIDPDARSAVNYPGSVRLVGDAREGLAQLADSMTSISRGQVVAQLAKARDTWRDAHGEPTHRSGALDPWAAMSTIRSVLPARCTVVADCGTPTPYLAARWEVDHPGRTIVTPRGHGPMGYAMPGAVGAAHASGDEPVVVFTTDGSMLMAGGALETAARSGKPILYIQLTNGSMGWIKALQHYYHEGRFFSTQLSRYNAVQVASGFGLFAVRASTLEDLATAVKEALARGGPAFIDVPVPDEHEALPPVSSWQRARLGTDLARPVY